MPQVIKIRPKGIYVTIEMSVEEMESLKDAIVLAAPLRYNGDIEKEKKAADYFALFFDFLEKLLEDLKDGA